MSLLLAIASPSGGVTGTLAVTLDGVSLASTATVTATIEANLAATLDAATLSSTATVTPASAAVTATLAVTLQDATLSATATVPGIPVTPSTDVGGGGGGKTWRKRKEEDDALKAAIRSAMYGVEEAVEVEAEAVQDAAPFTKRGQPAIVEHYALPVAKDYSTEQAHLSALTAALDRVYAALPAIQARRASEIAEARAKREAKVAKVRKLLRMMDLVDAA